MKALALTPGTTHVELIERPEPKLTSDIQIEVEVIEVGICGTDREEVAGGRADAAAGSSQLVIGHEFLGRVVAVGPAVHHLSIGDLGLFTVRRSCGICAPCGANRSDMCQTGAYTERGIKSRDGYETERVVDEAQYFIPVPETARSVGVLTEPLSIAEKAINEAGDIQATRLGFLGAPVYEGKTALVAGLGAVGLLTTAALRLRGAAVFGLDIVDPKSRRAALFESLGGTYIDGRDGRQSHDHERHFDFIFDASGVAKVEFDLPRCLAADGIYSIMGIPGGDRSLEIHAARLMRTLVLENQVMVGSVNASARDFASAVDDLAKAVVRWPGLIESFITERYPYTEFDRALFGPHEDEIKTTLVWSK